MRFFDLKKQIKKNAINKHDIQNIMQFIKFGIVGVSNTLVSWACYYIILWINDSLYLLGGIIGTIVSIANAFFWNNIFVFKSKEKPSIKSTLIRLGKTYISYGSTSLLGMLLLWIEVNCFNLNKALAPPINLIITIPLNFFINKFWTFKDKGEKQ